MHRFGTSTATIPTTRTTSPGNGDLPYTSSGTSGGWKDEAASGISLLASSSQAAGAMVVAINTLGLQNIQVSWICRTILQQASRDCSIALQYRVGTSGNFIDVGSGTTYTSQGKTAGDASGTLTETLPAGAENQAVVQVRWVYWESNGTTGSRDRLAVDDLSITGSSAAAPEIAVSGNSTDIADGDASPSLTDHTDFGTAGVVGDTVVRTFTITNSGNAALTIDTVQITGAAAGDFSVSTTPSASVAAGAATTLGITFDPSASGTRAAAVSFGNNDADENPFNFSIQGTGAPATINLSPGSLNFTTTSGNSPADQSFAITNTGSGTLNYSISDDAAWLTTSPSSGSLGAGAGAAITVSINSASLAVGPYSATITVADAAAGNSPQTVSVSLTVASGATPPTVTTAPVTTYSYTTATVDGEVTSSGGATVTERGVAIALLGDPFTAPSHVPAALAGVGTFSVNLTGLSPNTAYHTRAYAVNSVGTSYGADETFTTPAQTAPTVSTDPVTATGPATASGGGNVTADGGATVTSRGVCWNITGSPTTSDPKTSNGTGTGTFGSSLTGLTAGQSYYVRAYAVNSIGTSYGSQQTVTADCFSSAPIGLYANPTNATGFTAHWTASAGAATYRLDVATNSSFVAPGAPGALATHEGTLTMGTGGTWTENNVTQGSSGGNDYIQLKGPSGEVLSPAMNFDVGTAEALYFSGATFGTVSAPKQDIIVSISTDNGGSWQAIGTNRPTSSTAANYTYDLSAYSGTQVKVRFTTDPAASATQYPRLDAIAISNFAASTENYFVSGYSNLSVSGTGQAVAGLTEGQAYWWRVRAAGSNGCESALSSNATVTTIFSTPAVTFSAASAAARAETGSAATVNLQLSITADATVNVHSAGTALIGSDFTLSATQFVFTAGGATSQALTITPVDDTELESTETIQLELAGLQGATAGAFMTFQISLTDAEPAVLFAVSSTSVVENAGTYDLVIWKTLPLNNVSGELLVGGSATQPGDYTLSGTTFSLNGATTQAVVTLTLTDDAVAELPETAVFTLSSLTEASTGTPSTAFVTIEDDADGPQLNVGAVAIVGLRSFGDDTFAFVALTNLAANTLLKFTDKAWDGAALTNNEGTIEWLSPAEGVASGTVVVVTNPSLSSVSVSSGTVGRAGNFALSTAGDQLLLYQGVESAPVFLHAVNDQGAAVWQGSVGSTSDSLLPAGLVDGVSAVALTEFDNQAYAGPLAGEAASLFGFINSAANWSGSDGTVTFPTAFTLTGPIPEIAVLGTNGLVIAAGDATPATTDGTDFGTTPVSGGQVDRTFTITNSGSAALNLTLPLTIGGPHAADFSILTPPSAAIPPGAGSAFTVRFDPGVSGVRTATVSIVNDDLDENPYTFTVKGTAQAGALPAASFVVSGSTSVLESVGSFNVGIALAPSADATVRVAVISGATATLGSDFSLSATQFVFAAGGATLQTLTVNVADDATQEYVESATLRLENFSYATGAVPTNVTFYLVDNDDPAPLNPGDVAVIGRDSGADHFSLLALTNLGAGQTIYFTDNGWGSGAFRNTTGDGDGNEQVLRLRINSAVAAGTILRTSDTGDARWTWTSSGSIAFGGSASFARLQLPGTGGDQIYAFQVASMTTNPLLSASSHVFVFDDSGGFEPASDSNTGDITPGLSSNANTAVSFDFNADALAALDLAKAGTNVFGTKEEWLAYINVEANWTTAGSLPSGGLPWGVPCDGGRAPVIVAPGDHTATVGSQLSFTVLANDPTCLGPAMSATGLPAGATFSSAPYGSNSIGTFTWTPGVTQTGTHPVRIVATDSSLLTTSLNLRVYVRAVGESTNSAGVPASQTNWAVSITNLYLGAGASSVTVAWQSVVGITYDVYRSYNSFGSGMAWTKVTAGLEADATGQSVLTGAGSTQQFYQVVPAGFSPSSNGVWGIIRPSIKASDFTMLAPPLGGDRAFGGSFGSTLASVLSGNNDGVIGEVGDEVFFFDANGQWVNLYLDGLGTWRDSLGAVATQVLNVGQGILVQRNTGSSAQPVFTGPVGNAGRSTNTLAVGWNIIGLSEGKLVPLSSAFSDLPLGGSLNASYDEDSADLLVILDTDGSWNRYQRMPDGQWYDLTTLTPASISLKPGQGYYFVRRPGNGNLTVRY